MSEFTMTEKVRSVKSLVKNDGISIKSACEKVGISTASFYKKAKTNRNKAVKETRKEIHSYPDEMLSSVYGKLSYEAFKSVEQILNQK